MRFEVIYSKTIKEEFSLAGKSDLEWTKSNLGKIQNGFEFTLILNSPAPLLSEQYLVALAKKIKQKEIKKVSFEVGELVSKTGSETVRLDALETSVVTNQNKCLIERKLYEQIALSWLLNGVNILSTDNVYIDSTVRLEEGCTIYPFSILKGRSVIKRNAVLLGNNYILNSEIGENVKITSSYIYDSTIGNNSTVGPFAHIRLGSVIGENVRVGDFVEIKNSVLHNGVKSAHLTYVGDAEIGENTNIGCGTVFCNYDGVNKHHTTVGKNVFVGANTNLIAPLSVGNNSFIAGGSTITEDIPEFTFAIGRERQVNKKRKQE